MEEIQTVEIKHDPSIEEKKESNFDDLQASLSKFNSLSEASDLPSVGPAPSFESIINKNESIESLNISGFDLLKRNNPIEKKGNSRAFSASFVDISKNLAHELPKSKFSSLVQEARKPQNEEKPSVVHYATKTDKIIVGTQSCDTVIDEHFFKIRNKYTVKNIFLKENFDFLKLKKGDAKGGDLMAHSIDRKFIVKELNLGDFKSLSNIAEDLSLHLCNQSSLITPILCMFTYNKKHYFAMKNLLPNVALQSLYDLKGCADDKKIITGGKKIKSVHRRWYNLSYWCMSSQERKQYFQGKLEALHQPNIPLTKTQKKEMISKLTSDVEFLKAQGLMDYSLLVGTSKEQILNEYSYYENENLKVFIGVIDFLQVYDAKKKIAHFIKCFERNKATVNPNSYGERFLQHFVDYIVPTDSKEEDEIRLKAEKRMLFRCFPFRLK
eukprot:snap_masked-scaffold_7-processed-gene-4.52-mRNA-1 protein AED:1.00 eAED:1.00 QI:0/-1/0/0/-1/1/1/0/438